MREFFVNNKAQLFFDGIKEYFADRSCDLYLVQAEYIPNENGNYSDFLGIDKALTIPDDAPLLFCSFMPQVYFYKNKELATKFFALMGRKNTIFIDTISMPEDYYKKYLQLLTSKKEEDLLALELEKKQAEEKILGSLKHSIFHLKGNEPCYNDKISEVIVKARQAGFRGEDQEILEKILNFSHDLHDMRFAGKYFPGVFCDLEGTLFLFNGEINLSLLAKLKEFSFSKPITLWTSGDLEEYHEKLLTKEIFWKLVSKLDFAGAEVEIAFDDYSYDDFQKEFKIKVRSFNPA